nr:MAG TPA: Minor structural protein putative tail fiber [Caudoviricetes sp.]
MELGIYSKDGRLKLSVAPGDNGACSCGIQEESILAVSFTAFECIALEVYDYADFEGRRYWILERYLPQMNARREWAYSIRMSGAEGLAGQTLMVNPEDDDNPVLTLSAPAREHAALIVANMNRRTGTTEWKVGEVVVSEYIDIEYTGKYASDALSELSAAAKTEWWFDGMTLNISRCEFGECIPLSYGNGLIRNISRNIAEGVKFFTRLFPVGSSRNIDPDKYGHSRLQLPGGIRYVEQDTDLGIIEHFEQEAFERIFPRRIGTVGVVRHEERIGEDGKPFTVWYFTDPEIPFDPNQYEIGGLVKRITFQSGELLGREFEVNYDSQKKEFEIITQWPYDDDMQLPSEPLIPASGDEYVLWNISMPESYYPAAEQEFKTAVDTFMSENRKDVSVFQAQTDFTVIDQRALDLRPGQRIRLESAEYFPDTGFRETRIVSISRSVVRPGSMTLKMSDVLSTGRISRIESNIASVERLTKQVSSEFPDIIRSWEETPASDTTLYSSRKSEREFLNKRRGGTVEADVIFDKDITIGGSVVSKDFRQGDFSGSGFGAYRDRNGNAVLEADILKIRKEAIFNEAVINQVTFRVGATVFSNGGCEITRVEELETAFRCYYDNKEGRRYSGLTTGDQVRCQRYDPTQHAIIKYYWRLVTAVGEDYVELSKSDADGSASPEAGDEIAQFGNRSDITRQSAIVINPLDGGSVEVYAHIDAYSLSEKNYVGMGVNPQTGEAYMYAYGDMFFGDRDLADPKSSWITYQKKEGEERRRLCIKADVTFGADSSGLGNLSEFKAQQQQIDDARKEAEEAKKEVAGIQIGGENLLDDSKSLTTKNWSKIVANVYYEKYQGYQCAVIRNSENGGVRCNQTFEAGMNVVSSVWVFSEQACNIGVGIEGYGNYKYSLSDNEVGKWVRVVLQQRTTDNKFVCYLLNGQTSYVVAFRMPQMEEGNKATAWSPSIADQEEAIDAAQQTADNAAAGVDSLKNFTDEAFADGIVDRAEAAAIGKYTNSVNETRKAADAAYAEIYGNPLLGGTAKSNLQAAKSAFDTAAADLLAAIATAADDGIASPGEQADVDTKYTLFNNAYGTFGTRLEEANKYMLTAVNTASQGALQLSQELQGVVNNINETILPDLQAQIDGSIVSWGGEEVPTLSNYPANQWTSDTERKRHIGDYYDRKTTVDGQAAYERYKFAFENNAYQWVRIADSGGAAAIATAREALGLAGTKARIFFGATTPAVPYSVNDVWFRSSGAGATLETTVYISNADKGQQETAAAADWQLVDDSQVRLRQMSSDGVISREEKASLRNRLAQIQEAYTSYQNDAATYGVSIAGLAAAYSALVNFLTGTVAVNNDTDTTLSAEQRSAYNAAFAAYDAEVSRFSNLVADAISQGKVDDIQFSAVNLVDGSHADWVAAKANASGYDGTETVIYIDHTLIRGKQITYRVELKGENAQAPQLGFEIKVHFTDNTDQWIARYASPDIPDRGTFEKTYVFSSQIQDKEIEYARLYPIFRDLSGEPVSGKLYIKHEFVAVGNKIPSTWAPSITDQEKYTDDKVDGIQIGGVNLLNDSETLQSWEKNTSYTNVAFEEYQGYKSAVITNSVGTYAGLFQNVSGLNVGDEYMESVWVFAEQPTTIHYGLQLYEYSISGNEVGKWIRISDVQKAPSASKAFLCTANLTDASHKIAFRMAQLEAGNKVTAWSPSIADQEKYADETAGEAVNGVETQIDASKLDQNTYYPVTIKLNGIARSKITVRVNLSDTQPGKPAWSTYKENRFSCQAVWYNNGNSWGSNYDKRVVEEYQHRYADGRPIGSVGQMTNSSNEYIYVRGGGVYRFFATNAGTPVLHTEAYTVDEQTVDLKTSVEPLVSLQEQANSTQQEAETTRQAIADMNDDTIFDVSEKQSIRTQWENISGYARTDVSLDSLSATNGSYYRVRDMAKAAGISTAGLLAAVNSLRVKLNDYALYTASNTPGFDRAGLAVLFTAYYAQEIDVLNAVSQKYTDGKVADIETSMKDYDYLKLVFPNNTVDNNGVFLSQLMAVKNGTSASAAVVAGLYGGGVDSLNNAGFKDTTHGILMMFAGATSIQNVAAAKTRIYGDGTLYTSKLVAQAGTIAGFTIGTGYIGSENLTGSEYFYLSSSVIKNGKKDTYAMIGDTMYREKWKVAATLYNHYGSTGIGLVVDMGDNSHAAIYVPNGTFSGFRPMSRSYDNGTYTLKGDEEETVFFVNTSKGSTTFYLPSNPQPDQRYEIRKLHSGNSIIINAQNNGDIYVTGSNNPSSQISWTGRRCVTIQYSKNLDAWVMWFSYEA